MLFVVQRIMRISAQVQLFYNVEWRESPETLTMNSGPEVSAEFMVTGVVCLLILNYRRVRAMTVMA